MSSLPLISSGQYYLDCVLTNSTSIAGFNMYVVFFVFLISIREISTQKPFLHGSCRMLRINFCVSSEFDTKVNEGTKEIQIFVVLLSQNML